MTDSRPGHVATPTRILAALSEVIGAIDRRIPHVERSGEVRIASDARRLRREAVAPIDRLARAGSDGSLYSQDLVEEIMTDDGGPPGREREHGIAMQRSQTT
jgi:hypothetical protein